MTREELIDHLQHLEQYTHYSEDAPALREVIKMLTAEQLPSAQPEIVRCHKCIHWNRDTIRQNSNDAGWWNEAICERHSDENWTSWKDADWSCADAERRPDAETEV